MILVADMVQSLCPNVVADSAVARRTADGFATVKQQERAGRGSRTQSGLVRCCPPTVPYISQRAAYDGLQRAIAPPCGRV